MSYYFTKVTNYTMTEAREKVTEALKTEGFGVLTEIDVQQTLKNKLDVDFRPYLILGACNPSFAYQALTAEPNIGAMLPCNVILQQTTDGGTEISAVDPVASMKGVDNSTLGSIATEVQQKLQRVIDRV